MVKWYNWTTFDVITDLLFGEPLGCLQDLQTHKYIELLFKAVRASRLSYIMLYMPWSKYVSKLMSSKDIANDRKGFYLWVASQTHKRITRDTSRPDFFTHILAHNDEKGGSLTEKEMESNAQLILIAGSETTATLLSGTTYALLQNPEVMQKLKDEVRGRWKRYEDITLDAVNNAPYLLAVLSEGLRWFPPVPTGFERRVPQGGEIVSGYFLPENTAVCVSAYPAYRSERNFKDPDAFVPERWMGDKKYEDDKRSGCQRFSFGPRNCLGNVG